MQFSARFLNTGYMHIHLFDPGYIRTGGHHVEWDSFIARELVERGHEVRLYCSSEVTEAAAQAFATYGPVMPLFDVSPYARLDDPQREQSFLLDAASSAGRVLQQAGAADLWLWPTLFPAHLLACAEAGPAAPVAGCIHHEPGYLLPGGRKWWQLAFDKCREAGLSLNLSATTPALQALYARIAPGISIGCAPIAHDGLPPAKPKTRMRRIGFFGQQRREKGVDILGPLIAKLLDAGYEVVLHDSKGAPDIGSRTNLTTLGYLDDFAREIARCDLVVTPYDPVQYHFRLSGIVAEALACGVPVVVPSATASMRLARETGAGVAFANRSANSIFQAICTARNRYPELAQSAFTTSRAWASRHGIGKFVDHLLGSAA